MIWATIAKLLLGVADKALGYAEDRQLIKAGEAREARTQLKRAQNAIRRAMRGRRASDGVLDGRYDRDRKG